MATIEPVTTPPQTPLQMSTHSAALSQSRSSPNKSVVSSPRRLSQRAANPPAQTRPAYLDHEDFSNAVYVGNLEMTISNDALMKIFGRFGTIESVYRPPIHTDKADRTTHFAFIKYTDAESAQRAMQQADNILLGRRRLVVRPRIRSYMNRSFNRSPPSSSPQKSNQYPPFSYSHMPTQYYFPYNTHVNQNYMSKILSVFNLPYEMTPKDLFCLFSELGRVEGAFIYNVVDNRGRRVGEVAMGSFYHAKKALESLNNTTLNGYILELAFKPPTLPTPQFITPINSSHSMMYAPPNSIYSTWQYPPPAYSIPNPTPIPWSYASTPIDEAMAGLSFYEDTNVMNSRRNSLTSSVASAGYAHIYEQQKANIDHAIPLGMGTPQDGFMFYDPMTGLPIPMQPPRSTVNEIQDVNIPTTTAPVTVNHSSVPLTTKKAETTTTTAMTTVSNTAKSTTPGTSVASQNAKTESTQSTAPGVTATNSPNSSSTFMSFNTSSISTSIVPESHPADPKNLYIKNLDDDIISHPSDIETLFKPYGTIVSSHLAVVPGTGISKGYGFVAFSKAEEAIKAKKSLDGSMVGRKRVFVSWAERRADREKRLKEIFKTDNKMNIVCTEPDKDIPKTEDSLTEKDETKTITTTTVEVKNTLKTAENTSGANLAPTPTPNPMTVLSKWRGTPLSGIVEVEEPNIQTNTIMPIEQTTSESEFKLYSENVKSSQSMTTEIENLKTELDKDSEQGQVCLRVRDENTSPKKTVTTNIKKKGGWYRKRWSSGWGGNYGGKKDEGDSPVKDGQSIESSIKDVLLERIADKENCESKSI
ncbi:hypothetical protein PORY_001096 [Pneumocystis oryctolagi]|uniref:Uncharacterized protein n=1 Tax=Pneumocystis oryctolagi TaxID=42067 RepID=A0ACB7CDG8_9ASCO|nr:hypothetical protein PORY_001096 [Pneumocystis oryctolagi]